ncbi:putative RTA1 domain protein, partial [Aureobasidium melanogenum]
MADETAQLNDNASPDSMQTGARKRQKVTRACDACKSRKKRCTGDQPCAPCIKVRGKCTYEAQYNRGIAVPPSPAPSGYLQHGTQASPTQISPAPPQSTDNGSSRTYHSIPQYGGIGRSARRQSSRDVSPSRVEPEHETAVGSLASAHPSLNSGGVNRDETRVSTVQSIPCRRLSSEPNETLNGQYLGPSSAQSFLDQALRRSGEAPSLLIQSPSNVEIDTSTLSFGDAKVCQADIAQFAWPDRGIAIQLLDRYFEFASPTYRYMHEPTMHRWLDRIYDKDDVSVATQACVLLIFASAAAFTIDSGGDTVDASSQGWQLSETYYQKAETLLSEETGPPRLESVQARFAAVQYLLSSSRPNKGLFTFGTMVQLMQAVGLHRKAVEKAGSSIPDPITVQMHRRLFWCAFTLDKYLSIIMGRMPLLHIDNTNQALPMVVNDEDLTSEGVRQHISTYGRDCLLHATVAHIEIGITLARASQEQCILPSVTERCHVEAAIHRGLDIHDWHSRLPPILSGVVHPSSLIPCFRRQHSILTLARLHAIMFVTRPLLLRDLSTDLQGTDAQQYRDQLRTCIRTARDVVDLINSSSRKRVLFPAFWFSQYIAFSAISIIHIYIIQLSRHRIPADLFSTASQESDMMTVESLYQLAKVGQGHLAEAGLKSAPVWRYGPILESLSAQTGKYLSLLRNSSTHELRSSDAPMPRTIQLPNNSNAHQIANYITESVAPGHVTGPQPGTDVLWMNGHETLWNDLMAENLDNNYLTMDFWPQFDNLPMVLYSLYVYAPNKVAPVLFTILYGISAVGHIWQCARYRAWRMIGLQPMCAVFYTAGYALREYGAFDYLYSTTNLNVYIISQVLIYICPPLLELCNYHVLGRILYYVPYCAPFPPNRIMSLFGALVAVVEALNGLGVAFASNPSSSLSIQELGSKLTKASLAVQLAVIVVCIVFAGLFSKNCKREGIRSRKINIPLTILSASMFLILIRCIYRLVEHLGNVGLNIGDLEAMRELTPILRYEWFFYVFESTTMLLNSVIWNVWHPGRYLPRLHNVQLSPDGSEVEVEEDADTRPLLAKAGSILTFGILFRHKKTQRDSSYSLDSRNSCISQT